VGFAGKVAGAKTQQQLVIPDQWIAGAFVDCPGEGCCRRAPVPGEDLVTGTDGIGNPVPSSTRTRSGGAGCDGSV
jgi:hypothetical protein